MGSGKGRRRRVGAVAPGLVVGEMDPRAWDLFIADRKLLQTDIGAYYGLGRSDRAYFSPQEHAQVAQELLGDLGVLGAFRWPDGADLSRLEVVIGDYHLDPGPPVNAMMIHDKQTGFDALIHVFPHPHILNEPEMGSWSVRDLVVGLLEAMKTISRQVME